MLRQCLHPFIRGREPKDGAEGNFLTSEIRGVAIIDQRNYDSILDNGFSSKHEHYYLGDTVVARPVSVRQGAVEFEYCYADGAVHYLTLFPIRQAHLTNLLMDAGFESVVRFGDFEDKYDKYEPDFIVQVARKS